MPTPGLTWNNGDKTLESKLFHIALLSLLVFAVYSHALTYEFVFDDNLIIVNNPFVTGPMDLKKIFSAAYWAAIGIDKYPQQNLINQYYRPLLTLAFAVEWRIFGDNPWGFHLVNILFHIFNTALAYLIARRLTGDWRPAIAAGLIFGLHPVHTESVTWISGLTDVMCMSFLGAAFYIHIACMEKDGSALRKTGMIALAASAFFLSLLCKEAAILFPALIIGYNYLVRKKLSPLPVVAYSGVAAAYLALRVSVLGGFIPITTYKELNAFQAILNAVTLLANYLRHLLMPVSLNALHVFMPVEKATDLRFIAAALFLMALAYLVHRPAWRNKLALFAALWTVLTIAPVLNVKQLGMNIDAGLQIFAERFLYIPSFGFALFAPVLWKEIFGRTSLHKVKSAWAWALIAATALYSVLIIMRNPVWKDNLTLFTEALKDYPRSLFYHTQIGIAYMKKTRLGDAERHFRQMIRINGRDAKGYYWMGRLNAKMRQWNEAIAYFEKGIEIQPVYIDIGIYVALSEAYLNTGRPDKAIMRLKEVVETYPEIAPARYNLGVAYQENGMLAEAAYQFKKTIELRPDFQLAQEQLNAINKTP